MNRHTSMFRLLYLLCLGLLLQSCITDDEDTTASITAAKTSVPVSAAAGEEEITIEASGTEWTVTEEIDWLEAAKVDNSTLRVSYEENPDTEERSGTVTAAISDQSVNITVTQEADKRPAFASDAAITDQTYIENLQIADLTLPEATGGDGTLTYSITPTLPAGLDFDDMTREISGTPTEVVEPAETFTYTVEDEDGDTAELTFTIQIVSSSKPAFVNVMIEAQTYVENVTDVMLTLPEAMGGDAPLTYSLTPALPAGLDFDAGTRKITGRPTGTTDEATYTYKATDSDDDTAELTFTIVVEADMMPAFGDRSIADQMYMEHEAITDLTLPEAMGGNGTLTYSLTPAPPMGLSFDATSRVLSGTPKEAIKTARTYTYTATDTDGDPVSLTFDITIDGVPAFADDAAIAAQNYTATKPITVLQLPVAMGGDGTLTYSLTPELPTGLSFNEGNRRISGRPAAAASSTEYTYTATDEDGDADMLTFTIEVEADAVPTFGGATVLNQIYSILDIQVRIGPLPEATGGNAPLTYSLTSSQFPPANLFGLSFDPDTRIITGVPDASPEPITYTLTVTDRDGSTATLNFDGTFRNNQGIRPDKTSLSAFARSTSDNTIRVRSDVAWMGTVNSTGDWITSVSPATSAGGNGSITIRWGVNTTFSERAGTINFTETTVPPAGSEFAPRFTAEITLTQAAPVALLTTTTYNIGFSAGAGTQITFSGLTFNPSMVEWWVARPDGSAATGISGISSVSVNDGSRAGIGTTRFTMDVDRNRGLTRNFELAIWATSTSGGTADQNRVLFTVSQEGRLPNGPIPISNLEQLNAVRYDLNADGQADDMSNQAAYAAAFPRVIYASGRYSGYYLTRDLDFNEDASYSDANANKTTWTTGTGWEPIGRDRSNRYANVFDGRGHKISNLYINRTGDNLSIGLFGQIRESKSTLSNVGLENVNITGGNSGSVGGLVGRMISPSIRDCYVSGGTIRGGDATRSSSLNIGGLAGYMDTGNIERCYVSSVTIRGGSNAYVGGLVARTDGSDISKCYVANLTINGGANAYVGGLSGGSSSTTFFTAIISQCYVSGGGTTGGRNANVGGLTGIMNHSTMASEAFQCYVLNNAVSGDIGANLASLVADQQSGSKIHDCYAAGRTYTNIRGTGSGTITDSYYQIASDGTDSGQARKAATLQDPEGYTGIYSNWDVSRVSGADDSWDFGGDDEYPVLKVDFNNNSSTADDVMRQRP